MPVAAVVQQVRGNVGGAGRINRAHVGEDGAVVFFRKRDSDPSLQRRMHLHASSLHSGPA